MKYWFFGNLVGLALQAAVLLILMHGRGATELNASLAGFAAYAFFSALVAFMLRKWLKEDWLVYMPAALISPGVAPFMARGAKVRGHGALERTFLAFAWGSFVLLALGCFGVRQDVLLLVPLLIIFLQGIVAFANPDDMNTMGDLY